MKIIDLLNKIANGEEVPKCIRYNNYYYFKDSEYRDFVNEEVDYSTLNDEIEVIEEPKKIENISDEELEQCDCEYDRICLILDRLDEIIDYINKENK